AAGDVGRQQGGGALHPAEGAAEAAGDGAGEGGLAAAGHVLDQHVTAGEHRLDDQLHRGPSAVHDLLDVVDEAGSDDRRVGPGHGAEGGHRAFAALTTSTIRPMTSVMS